MEFLRGIKTQRNFEIIRRVTALLPGYTGIYKSADHVIDDQDASVYPTEFLNAQIPTGMPPHELTLKVGRIVMLIRSISIQLCLCNGTD